jgi:hypothetical protein
VSAYLGRAAKVRDLPSWWLFHVEENVRKLLYATCLLILSGCGSDGNVRAVTPVMADTRGTYRLAAMSFTFTAPDGTVRTSPMTGATGTLRLTDTGYSKILLVPSAELPSGSLTVGAANGSYLLGASVNTILNSRAGTFALASVAPPSTATGVYQVIPDFTLTLNYDTETLPDQSRVASSETWVKESDSPSQ